jgi:hypothetical protein
MDSEDKKDIIRAIKKKGKEDSDAEFDFMSNDPEDDEDDYDWYPDREFKEKFLSSYEDDDDDVEYDWSTLTDEEKSRLMTTEDEETDYGPGDEDVEGSEIILDDYMEDDDYIEDDGDLVDWNSLSDEEKGVVLNPKKDYMGGCTDYMSGCKDYMDDPYMMPKTAPTKPTTKPDVKPGTDKPTVTPSKRPFTRPPHIPPDEESAPKASEGEDFYGINYDNDDTLDYMGDVDDIGGKLRGRPTNKSITSRGTLPKSYLSDKQRLNKLAKSFADLDMKDEYTTGNVVPYYDDVRRKGDFGFGYENLPSEKWRKNPLENDTKFDYDFEQDDIVVNPNKIRTNFDYMQDLSEDHLNTKMVSIEQEMAYEDVEDMARQNGLEISWDKKDKSSDPEEETVYLNLKRGNKIVGSVRINAVGDVEIGGPMKKSFKGQPLDNLNDFYEYLGEKNIEMSPKTAPTKPTTKPDVKPGTDKPTPSKRPFTRPPHIPPDEESAPKARVKRK